MNNFKPLIHPATKIFVDAVGFNNLLGYEIYAVNELVKNLFYYKLWDLFYGIYPLVGRTATSHSINLKLPRSFNIAFYGTVFHNEFGIQGDGSTGLGEILFNPSINSTANSLSMGVYSRTPGQNASTELEASTGTPTLDLLIRYTNDICFGNNTTSGDTGRTNRSAFGFYINSRISSNDFKIYKNGSQFGDITTSSQGSLPNSNIYIFDGNPLYSSRNLSFIFVAKGLTEFQAKTFTFLVRDYQRLLNRNMSSIEYLGSTAEGSAANGNITLTAPSSPQYNDIWIAVVHSSDQVTHTFTDWTEIFQSNGGGTTSHLSVWYFRYAGSTPNLIVTHSAGQSPIGGIAVFRGCKTSGSPANIVGTVGSGTGATLTFNGITPTISNCMLLACNGVADDNAQTLPTGFVAAFEDSIASTQNCYQTTAGNPDGSVALFYKSHKYKDTATDDFTNSQGTPADPWASVLIALEPETL